MIPATSLVPDAIARAKHANLEVVIRNLSQGEKRKASGRQIEQRRQSLRTAIEDPGVVETRIERILKGNDLTDINYLSQGMLCAKAVGRVVIQREGQLLGFGTGSLVAPGVLLTNHHVLTSPEEVRDSLVQFRYERDLRGNDVKPVEFSFAATPEPILFRDLDFALVAVQAQSVDGQPLESFGWLPLSPRPGKAFVGEYLTIIQHPQGERKQVCVRENKLLKYFENGPFLWYETDTSGGSSGSPVFNGQWEVVALHHSSVPKTKKVNGQDVWLAKNGQPWHSSMGDDEVDWIANEGVRISRICDYLRTQHAGHPLAQAVLSVEPPPMWESAAAGSRDSGSSGIEVRQDGSGRTRIVVPVEIDVSTGLAGVMAARPIVQPHAIDRAPTPTPPRGPMEPLEKIDIDQTNYNERTGYLPKFLGDDFRVPLPKVTGSMVNQVFKIGAKSELKYWTYSVVLHKGRGLALFSAANVDTENVKGKRDSDNTWFDDTRVADVDDELQVGKSFYKKQKTFEADRSLNPFDQGHLTRRLDAQWGETGEIAKRNGDDSFHYPNCAPQHWQFNQNARVDGIWFRLEEAATNEISGGGRLCIINGPIFDAPLSVPGQGGKLMPNLRGTKVPDGTFGGVKIPKQFYKVIAYVKDDELQARAFVVSQEELLATIDRYYPEEAERTRPWLSDLEVHLYQVRISDLEHATKLDFGPLRDVDDPDPNRPIEGDEDFRF